MYKIFFANPYSISCAEIGNCSAKTPTISAGFTNITHALLFLVGMLAVLFVIISGLQMALSAGNSKRYEQAKESLQYSIVGVILALVAYGLVSFIARAF